MSKHVLGLDVGERRIGLAMASESTHLVSLLPALDRQQQDVVEAILNIVHQHTVSTLVIGLPRGLDGQETAQTAYVRKFAAKMKTLTGLPIFLQDEAGTSVEAEARLRSKGKPYTKADIDSEAAAIILTDYLSQAVELKP